MASGWYYDAGSTRPRDSLAILAVAVWLGGLAALGAVAAPVVFSRVPWPSSADAMTIVFRRFDAVAMAALRSSWRPRRVARWLGPWSRASTAPAPSFRCSRPAPRSWRASNRPSHCRPSCRRGHSRGRRAGPGSRPPAQSGRVVRQGGTATSFRCSRSPRRGAVDPGAPRPHSPVRPPRQTLAPHPPSREDRLVDGLAASPSGLRRDILGGKLMAIRKWSGLSSRAVSWEWSWPAVRAAGPRARPTAAGATTGGCARCSTAASSVGPGDDAADSGGGYDGTTGKVCTSDADCVPDGGPSINTCSIDYSGMFTIGTVPVALFATPVCMIPPSNSSTQGNCDPVPGGVDDGLPHFCDGPDNPAAPGPGICLPFDQNNPQPGQGTCYPYARSRSTARSRPDVRARTRVFRSPSSAASRTGQSPDTASATAAASKTPTAASWEPASCCQTDIGFCTMSKLTRTKAIGVACTASTATSTTVTATDDETTGACSCDADPTTGAGFCSSACIVGGLPCPNGWTCDRGTRTP